MPRIGKINFGIRSLASKRLDIVSCLISSKLISEIVKIICVHLVFSQYNLKADLCTYFFFICVAIGNIFPLSVRYDKHQTALIYHSLTCGSIFTYHSPYTVCLHSIFVWLVSQGSSLRIKCWNNTFRFILNEHYISILHWTRGYVHM